MQRTIQRHLSTTPLPRLRGVVFDMDGTLTVPNLDFTEMYSRCNVPLNEDLLEAISQMTTENAKKANDVIDEMEEEGRRTLQLEPGTQEFAKWLHYHSIPVSIVTRNTMKTVDALQKLWDPLQLPTFHPAISRDVPIDLPAKPHPAAMQVIAKEWNVEKEELNAILMVGDSPSNDVVFGKAAGTATALVDSGRRYVEEKGGKIASDGGADFVVQNLALLPNLLWQQYTIGKGVVASSDHLSTSTKHPPPVPVTELDIASANSDIDGIKKCLLTSQENVDGDEKNALGRNSALIFAADSGCLEGVELLIQDANGDMSKLNALGYLGATAVSRAARRGMTEILELLLKAGANPNLSNDKMQYPMHFAAFNNHTECVKILLKYDASTYVLDRKGRTPAEDTKDVEIRELILSSR